MMPAFQSIDVPAEFTHWTSEKPSMMRVAAFLNRVSPRGKGAFPRAIGKCFGRHWQTTIETDTGCRLAVDPQNLDLFVTIENDGAWEPWVRRACKLATRSGGVMFDVGANAGAISIETARSNPDLTVKSFEPQAQLARLVAISAAINDLENVEVFQVAVGESEGTVNLHLPAHALHASLKTSGETGEQTVEVPLVSLDHVVEQESVPPPTVIKIDVEGAELGVLKGAARLLRRHTPVVIFEANESSERFGYRREDLFLALRSCADYRFFEIAPGDVLACPPARFDEFSAIYPLINFSDSASS